MLSSKLRDLGGPASRWQRRSHQLHQHTRRLSTTAVQVSDNEGLQLSKEEAVEYLENVLSISDPIGSMKRDKLDFLTEVQRKTKSRQPYTNTCFLVDRGETPTPKGTKEMMSARQGGGCLNINGFLVALLRAMGYDACLIPSGISKKRSRVYAAHAGLVVRDVTEKGSLHLVDPGSRYPTFDPVDLSFSRVSPEYGLVGGRGMRFFKESLRVVRACCPVVETDPGSTRTYNPAFYYEGGQAWVPVITYYINQSTSWQESSEVAKYLMSDSSLFLDAHDQIVIIGFTEQGLFTALMGHMCIQYDNQVKADVRKFATDSEVIDNALSCFPQFAQVDLQKAIDYTKTVRSQKTPS